jgi:hypothetical protein
LAGIETALGDTWKPLAEGCRQNCAAKDTLIESAQLALEDEEFDNMIGIYPAAAIYVDHEDAIDAKS